MYTFNIKNGILYLQLESVSEGALLRDLIFVFQDIEGKYIRFNHKEDGFRILPQVTFSSVT